MTPADLARRLYLDQCRPNDLSQYGERAAIAALVPLIEALEAVAGSETKYGNATVRRMAAAARAALTPQPEEVA